MTAAFANGTPTFIATLLPGRSQRRLALAVIGVSLALFLAAAPFAKVQLAPVWAFIPAYQSALVVSDLITATLLFGQFHILRSRALLVLGTGYLFTAFMAIAHGLSFPGLFAPGGLLGAGPQSTAWLYMFWHAGFPLFVIAYAVLKDKAPTGGESPHPAAAICACSAGALVLAVAATLVTTAGQNLLPGIMIGNRYTPSMIVVVSSVWVFSLLALLALWRLRSRSVLDLWLMVVACAWLFDIALSAVLNGGRFDFGFYAGRIYGLFAASFVLIMLLVENGVLYTRLVESHSREHEKAAELEQLGNVLEEKNRQLQEASTRKSEFLANMSHELRTPLNAIIGFSEILKDGLAGELPQQQREFVTDIYNSGHHLLSLINDILDLSKVEAGKMELDLECVDVATLLESSQLVIKEKAAAHNVVLHQEVSPQLPPIMVDPRKLKQIVYNLLSNAVKFTPDRGRVTLRARSATRAEIDNWPADRCHLLCLPLAENGFADFLEITVEDTGIGIRPEDAPRLFQSFSQLDSSLSRRFEGTGLGLALVLKLAQLHGGTVAVASQPGAGSAFSVWLPWRQPATARPAASRDGRRLALVVEDDDAAAVLVQVQLEAEGLQVLRAASAEAALALLPGTQPSVIVLDLLLPGMDGWDFLAQLKQAESPWRDTPVVIYSVVADARRGFSLGASQVLQKPVGRAELAAALANLAFGASPRAAPKVLIVDDDAGAVDLLATYLADLGCVALRAYGGRDGIDTARRERPDLLVLDLLMPEVSGFDVVEAIKGHPDTAATPIIVVTAKELTREDRAALNGHVTDIQTKADFNHGRFAAEVRRALPALPEEAR
ncbi:MAG: response regulator [Rhodocyclales bacterium]|nr:response regulator [Rhodocyclales bacterium]